MKIAAVCILVFIGLVSAVNGVGTFVLGNTVMHQMLGAVSWLTVCVAILGVAVLMGDK